MDIADLLKTLKALPFPEMSDDDQLSDLVAELVELDGHYAGLATSALAGIPCAGEKLVDIERLIQALDHIPQLSKADEDIRRACRERMHTLLEIKAALTSRSRGRR